MAPKLIPVDFSKSGNKSDKINPKYGSWKVASTYIYENKTILQTYISHKTSESLKSPSVSYRNYPKLLIFGI